MDNLFQQLPRGLDEVIQVLAESKALRIERIVSNGQASPPDFWYDQEQDEWVVLLKGAATLSFEDGATQQMRIGDYLLIPAHLRHRVFDVSRDAVWLAIHF